MSNKLIWFKVKNVSAHIFPTDMLRYNHCWPRDSQAVSAMDQGLRQPSESVPMAAYGSLVVELLSTDEAPSPRWASFGWVVVSHGRVI